MNKLFRLAWKCFFCFISIIFLSSCGGGGADKEVAKSDADSSAKAAPAQVVSVKAAGGGGGFLHYLWTDRVAFDALESKKLVFRFVFGQSDSLTMHGWTSKGSSGKEFDSIPNYQLLVGIPTLERYGDGVYLGNEILPKDSIVNIKNKLTSTGAHYVIFEPYVIGKNLAYHVLVSDIKPVEEFDKNRMTTTTGSGTNPSPPKNY